MERAGATLATILGMFIGLAGLAVIVSPNARTSKVIDSSATGVSRVLAAATAPVTGASLFQSGSNFTTHP